MLRINHWFRKRENNDHSEMWYCRGANNGQAENKLHWRKRSESHLCFLWANGTVTTVVITKRYPHNASAGSSCVTLDPHILAMCVKACEVNKRFCCRSNRDKTAKSISDSAGNEHKEPIFVIWPELQWAHTLACATCVKNSLKFKLRDVTIQSQTSLKAECQQQVLSNEPFP